MPASRSRRRSPGKTKATPTELRIIGGTLGGRRIVYSGDSRTRPMKERVREAIFNLLGPTIRGTHAIDLFAGTGAIALEAISRGAVRATAVERHFPSARLIEQNAAGLGVSHLVTVVAGDAFRWCRQATDLGQIPCTIICAPPYAFYHERTVDMLELINHLLQKSPPQSQFVIETDEQFDCGLLPRAAAWDVRVYGPAVIAIRRSP